MLDTIALQTQSVTFQVPTMLPGLLYALVIGVIYAVANYRDSLTKGEVFNATMFYKTLIIGLAAGVFMYWGGIDPTTGAQNAVIYIIGNPVAMKFIDDLINTAAQFKVVQVVQAPKQ